MDLTCLIYNYKYIKEIEEKNLIISKIKNYLLFMIVVKIKRESQRKTDYT